jgi:hypothetical protein
MPSHRLERRTLKLALAAVALGLLGVALVFVALAVLVMLYWLSMN